MMRAVADRAAAARVERRVIKQSPEVKGSAQAEAGKSEQAVHGTVDPWLVWTDRGSGFTLAFTTTAGDDPWFVRVQDYPGVGLQLAARDPVPVPPGAVVTRGMRVLVADGTIDDAAVRSWADR